MLKLRAPAWAWLLLAAGLALFGSLGTWQLGRGLDKQAWIERMGESGAPTLALHAATTVPAEPHRAEARGSYLENRQLLADGHARAGQPGFHVWTPLRLADGALLLVNRGWIAQPERLDHLPAPPAPAGEIAVRGWWRALPEPGIRVGGGDCAKSAAFPVQVVYPTPEQLGCLFGEPVLPGLLLLDADAPGGFVRDWASPGLPPARHFGYAVTWYALGLTALFLFLKLNRKP